MTVDHKSGFVAEGGGQVNNGYGNRLPTNLLTGVNVTGKQTGVIGIGPVGVFGLTPSTQTILSGAPTGVQGQVTDDDGIGVQGIATGAHGTGVQGTSQDANGVEGISGASTGVFGQSGAPDSTAEFVGVGVVGQCFSEDGDSLYIGVVGLSSETAGSTIPYPANPGYVATGVLGVGDRYGGVFQSTPQDSSGPLPFANVQLTPVQGLQPLKPDSEGGYMAALPRPLPSQGQPGDIVAVSTPDGDNNNGSVELWVCIRIATAATNVAWARINFDTVVTWNT